MGLKEKDRSKGPPRKRLLTAVNARRATQALFLLLFLFLLLQTEAKGSDDLGYPVKLFLDFDPLLFIATALSSRSIPQNLYLSLFLLALTVVLGRVFCGWVCPLGTLNNLVGASKRWPGKARARGWFRVKYYLLLGLLAASVFTLQLTGVLDPLSLLVRSLSVSVHPALNYAINSGLDLLYAPDVRGLTSAAEAIEGFLRKGLLAFHQPHFAQGLLIGALFVGVLALNLVERRFWCRYLCPLGALLGLFSRWAFLKRSAAEGCNACTACDYSCQGNASPAGGDTWMPTECLYCWSCDDACPTRGTRFSFTPKKAPATLDLGRRRVAGAVAAGAASVAFFRATPPLKPGAPNPKLIRPPGSCEEPEFLAKCVKCGECMKVCITNGLQPALLEAGLEGIWSPVLVPKMGYCEYRCTLCGQVCPTGAIRRLALEEKASLKIGLAMIDKGRCLPYAHSTPCIVCEEVCPTPSKAIWLEDAEVRNREGQAVPVRQPHVDLDLCIGCGICEAKCPVLDRPAITVTSVGESRSRSNQLVLS